MCLLEFKGNKNGGCVDGNDMDQTGSALMQKGKKIMLDREQVIKGLECDFGGSDTCCEKECPYYQTNDCTDELKNDILALLKEQEPIEPTFKQDEKGIFVWCCGSCGAYMYHIYDGIDKAKEYAKFCRQCGKPVLWESW